MALLGQKCYMKMKYYDISKHIYIHIRRIKIYFGGPPCLPCPALRRGYPPPPPPKRKYFPSFSIYPQFLFTIQFYYKRQDVCKKTDPNMLKIGYHIFRNWRISDQFFQNLTNLKRLANFWDFDPIQFFILA
jgi:hypothetical protein